MYIFTKKNNPKSTQKNKLHLTNLAYSLFRKTQKHEPSKNARAIFL